MYFREWYEVEILTLLFHVAVYFGSIFSPIIFLIDVSCHNFTYIKALHICGQDKFFIIVE